MLLLVLCSACADEGTGRSFECQAKCHNAMGQPSEGFESYTINNASDQEVAEGRCIEMAVLDVESACGAGNTFDNECVCAPRSPN